MSLYENDMTYDELRDLVNATTPRHCVACGQLFRPDDYWQRKISKAAEDALEQAAKVCEQVLDERNAAVAALKFAAKLLSREDPYFSEMNETEMMAYLIKMPKEMK